MLNTLTLLLSFVLFVVFPDLSVAAPASARKEGPPPLVTVITVTEQEVNPQTEYVAHVEAIQTVDLHARVSGFLEEIHFKEGSDVRAGELLYRIEPAPYKMKVAVSRARVAKSQAALDKASKQLARLRSVRAGGVPVTDLESAEAAELLARADLQEAQAVLQLSEIDLGYTQILAPISGRIGATALSKGNLCGPTTGPLARIVQLDPIRVLFSLSENDIATVAAAQSAAAGKSAVSMQPQLKLLDGRVLENVGHIDFVDNRVDSTTGTIAVRAVFANPDGLLLPGQYLSLLANQTQTRQLPVIPQAAVLENREGRYVLLVNEQSQVEQRPITTGVVIGSLWAIEAGLQAGELVIVQGVQKVRPGQTVKATLAVAPQGN